MLHSPSLSLHLHFPLSSIGHEKPQYTYPGLMSSTYPYLSLSSPLIVSSLLFLSHLASQPSLHISGLSAAPEDLASTFNQYIASKAKLCSTAHMIQKSPVSQNSCIGPESRGPLSTVPVGSLSLRNSSSQPGMSSDDNQKLLSSRQCHLARTQVF